MKHTTKSGGRKKALAAVAALGIAAGGYGVYASSLTINTSDAFAAGTDTVSAGCDTTVAVKTNVSTTSANGTFPASSATVSEVDGTGCNGKTITINALGAGDSILASGQVAAVTGTSSYQINFNTNVGDANNILKYAVLIQ